jgi:hypothetical protein
MAEKSEQLVEKEVKEKRGKFDKKDEIKDLKNPTPKEIEDAVKHWSQTRLTAEWNEKLRYWVTKETRIDANKDVTYLLKLHIATNPYDHSTWTPVHTHPTSWTEQERDEED